MQDELKDKGEVVDEIPARAASHGKHPWPVYFDGTPRKFTEKALGDTSLVGFASSARMALKRFAPDEDILIALRQGAVYIGPRPEGETKRTPSKRKAKQEAAPEKPAKKSKRASKRRASKKAAKAEDATASADA